MHRLTFFKLLLRPWNYAKITQTQFAIASNVLSVKNLTGGTCYFSGGLKLAHIYRYLRKDDKGNDALCLLLLRTSLDTRTECSTFTS